jgi:transcriptional regulator with XRE-family HTH domain
MKITLKAARVNAGLSIKEAAKAYNIGTKTLWNYENGKTVPNEKFLKKLPDIYHCTYNDIIFLSNNYD